MPREETVNNATYADLLRNHFRRPVIKSKRRGLLSEGVLSLQDNITCGSYHGANRQRSFL